MKPEVRKQLEEMRTPYLSQSYEEIKMVGWNNLARITLNKRQYEPSIWSELRPDGKILLVVQLTRWVFLRMIGKTSCIGLLISQNNNFELVDEKYLMEKIGHP